jgi:HK97 family phage major capsid protein
MQAIIHVKDLTVENLTHVHNQCPGNVWIMSDKTFSDARKLKTIDGEYLWKPTLAETKREIRSDGVKITLEIDSFRAPAHGELMGYPIVLLDMDAYVLTIGSL